MLAPHFGEEPDLRRITEATRTVSWPKYVMGVDYRIGTDSTGDPAVWIRLIVKDDVEIESPAVQTELGRLRGRTERRFTRSGLTAGPT